MTKKELRRIYLEKRHSFSLDEYIKLNGQLADNFISSIDLSSVKFLHTFLPIEKNREPDTRLIIDSIRSRYPKIKISVPRVNDTTGTFENFPFVSYEQLRVNKWGIPEPERGSPVSAQELDMVLVPLIISDKQGQRVGYGKGYYDKFLSACRDDCKLIGICFFEPAERIDDVSGFDVPLDYCLTPSNLYHF